jgi:hypothetical protein
MTQISSRGRPRKAGPRHPSGKLVQKAEPNAKVVAGRRALLGDALAPPAALAAAEHPMALALARGWLTEEQHRAGEAFAHAWRRSHPQRRAPGLEELPEPAVRDLRRVGKLSDAELAGAFDQVFARRGDPADREAAETAARARYVALCRVMTADEQNEVFLAFCLASWPQWVVQRCAGRFETAWERKHRLLVSGLEAAAGVLQSRRRATAAVPGW